MIPAIYSKSKILAVVLSFCCAAGITGCGTGQSQPAQTEAESPENGDVQQKATPITAESAQDSNVDFAMLQKENPDIFAWIYVPGTQIDYPVLQSGLADDFYSSHNANGEEDPLGAVYIELANLKSMCDFNTVLHGNTGANQDAPFSDLYRFTDPVFFDEHENFYLYLDGNVLTYEIFAAYERDNTSLIRDYDFTYSSGCQQFLDDLYATRDMSMNLREGWDFITPYYFLVTLTTQKEDNPDKQLVVVAVLTEDVAGTITRVME